MDQLELSFFERDTLTVARELLGCRLALGKLEGMIVETEAYTTDAASHGLLPGERSRLMKETAGRVYVYLIYGMYHCLNFTADITGPGAVLIRAIEPQKGFESQSPPPHWHKLANGPGKLCRLFGIDLSYNGSLVGDKIQLLKPVTEVEVATSARIGISKAIDLPWRFYIPGNKAVSRFKTPQPTLLQSSEI